MPSALIPEYIADVFGNHVGNTYQEGLVDSSSLEKFHQRLENLKQLWDEREKPLSPSSGPRFYRHFVRYHADVVRYHMRKDLRESAGLGSPPSKFTTNASESLNAAIKRKVNFQESELPEFNDQMRQYAESQREEVIQALSGRGQFRLCHDVSHGVSTQVWVKMTTQQRREAVSAFENAQLPTTQSADKGPSSISIIPSSQAVLSVTAEDSVITSIPFVTLMFMWNKAADLLSASNVITPAPGDDSKARMVICRSQVVPHHVRSCFSGRFLCDKNCPQWMSSRYVLTHWLLQSRIMSFSSFSNGILLLGKGPIFLQLALLGCQRAEARRETDLSQQKSDLILQLLTITPFVQVWHLPLPCLKPLLVHHNICMTVQFQCLLAPRYCPVNFSKSARISEHANQCTRLRSTNLRSSQLLLLPCRT